MQQNVWCNERSVCSISQLYTCLIQGLINSKICSHANCAPSIAADMDPMVTDMFIQCKKVLSLAAEPKLCQKACHQDIYRNGNTSIKHIGLHCYTCLAKRATGFARQKVHSMLAVQLWCSDRAVLQVKCSTEKGFSFSSSQWGSHARHWGMRAAPDQERKQKAGTTHPQQRLNFAYSLDP